jgi:hypothetical protein
LYKNVKVGRTQQQQQHAFFVCFAAKIFFCFCVPDGLAVSRYDGHHAAGHTKQKQKQNILRPRMPRQRLWIQQKKKK